MFTGMLEWDVSNGGNFEMGGIPIGEIFKIDSFESESIPALQTWEISEFWN